MLTTAYHQSNLNYWNGIIKILYHPHENSSETFIPKVHYVSIQDFEVSLFFSDMLLFKDAEV